MLRPPHLVETALGTLAVELPDGPPDLWLWPGLFFDSRLHYPLAKALGRSGYRVAHINPPGYGGSTLRPGTFSLQNCGQAMLAVLDAMDVSSAVLGGTSWGGMTTMAAAIAQPERVRGMVLMNAPMDEARPDFLMYRTPLFARHLSPSLLSWAFLPHCLAPSTLRPHGPTVAAMLRGSLRSATPGARADTSASLLIHAESPRAFLKDLSMPTLQIAGTHDRLCHVKRQRTAADLFPDVTYVEFQDLGHLSCIEATDATAEAIGTFLASLREA